MFKQDGDLEDGEYSCEDLKVFELLYIWDICDATGEQNYASKISIYKWVTVQRSKVNAVGFVWI